MRGYVIDAAKAAELRRIFHSFYTTVKSCDEYPMSVT